LQTTTTIESLPLFETWIAAITEELIREGWDENLAKQQAEKAVSLVQGSLILSQALDDASLFQRTIRELPAELCD
jgi:hypothetical protein